MRSRSSTRRRGNSDRRGRLRKVWQLEVPRLAFTEWGRRRGSGLIAFDPQLARSRLEAFGTLRARCDACGRLEWRINGHLSGIWEAERGDGENLLLSQGIGTRVLAVVCDHCGNVRFHDWGLLTGTGDV